MIEVGSSGLYFDGGHKGHFEIYMEQGNVFRRNCHLDGDNVDCSGEIFKAIQKYGKFNVPPKLFLKNHEWLIRKCIMEQMRGQRSMVECYHCGFENKFTDTPTDNLCPPIGVPADWGVDYTANPLWEEKLECDKCVLSADAPLTTLKDFDLRSGYVYGLHMTGNIKSISNPKIIKTKYIQEGVLCDDDTSKTLDIELDNSIADFDKYHNGNKVEAFGIFKKNTFHVIDMVIIEENAIEPLPVNRNSETPGYNNWRKSIINRDKVCQCCGYDKHLEAHHMFGYKENPELAVNEHNGITLCKFCHDKYHSLYGLKDINPVDFVDFVKRFGVR